MPECSSPAGLLAVVEIILYLWRIKNYMMRKVILTACAALAMSLSAMTVDRHLWYTAPAGQWEESLPLGNGRLGMMPYGNPFNEKIVLNEISMWSGSEANYDNPEASKSLPEIQRLLKEGKNKEAQELMYTTFVPTLTTDEGTYGTYQVLGDLDVKFTYSSTDVTDYRRWLSLEDAEAVTTYKIGDVVYTQQCAVPRGENVMLYHVTASQQGALNFTATLSRPERAQFRRLTATSLMMSGTLDSGTKRKEGMKYAAVMSGMVSGQHGTVTATDSTITVTGADDAWIVIGAETDYLAGQLYMSKAENDENNALRQGDLPKLVAEGARKHRELFDRVTLKLPEGKIATLPTDERIEQFQTESDPSLAALYYNYGRYLLISSTMPGCMPPNLQGLWANGVSTPWNGDYHTNINVQMNHWPAEPGNLPELHEPLIDLVKRAVPKGEHTAKVFYGPDAEGWVMHMMTNPWGYTDPGQHPSWGATNTGGAWLCAHLWEHYLYNQDSAYLAEIYPVMKGAAEFFLSTMMKEPKHGWLVTAPSSSPENSFYVGNDTVTPISVCMGPAMDTQIVRELFTNVADAAHRLGQDDEFAARLTEAVAQLPPHQIGSDGRLMEWLEEYREVDPHHRHVSHLYALHPGNQISPINTPELADAARATLERRGDGGTGWSRAWKVNFWARLGDGNRAYKLFKALLVPTNSRTVNYNSGGAGTYPNLFCSHPPFQMDGNWGGTAGIGEMLLQSQNGFIDLLPALPDEWANGSVEGMKVRGGAEVDFTWSDGKVRSVTVTGGKQPEQRLKMPAGVKSATVNGKRVKSKEYIDLTLNEGESAEILFD